MTIIKAAQLDEDGQYSIELSSNWQGSETVAYYLYNPSDTVNSVASSSTGQFNGIKYIEGGCYYVRAKVEGVIASTMYRLDGFVKPEPVEKHNPFKDVRLSVNKLSSSRDNVFSFTVPFDNAEGNISICRQCSHNKDE